VSSFVMAALLLIQLSEMIDDESWRARRLMGWSGVLIQSGYLGSLFDLSDVHVMGHVTARGPLCRYLSHIRGADLARLRPRLIRG